MFTALRLFLARWKLRLLADELREIIFALDGAEPPFDQEFLQDLQYARRLLVREQVRTMARIKSLSLTQP